MTTKVIRAVITSQKMTLVFEDMSTKDILQGDPRLPLIFNHIAPQLKSGGVATLPKEMLEEVYANPDNHFGEYEEKSKGLVKFFRVARSAWNKIKDNVFDHEPAPVVRIPTQTLGEKPQVQAAIDVTPVVMKETVVEQLTKAGAKTVSKEKTSSQKLDEAETMLVAVVGGKAIPDAQNIENLVVATNTGDMPQGSVDAFLKRVSDVISKRRFSGEDLMTFMKKGDLPITVDGCLLVYKRVNKADSLDGDYKDCHTGAVKQSVGTIVSMDEELVDPNRSQDCSVGLHIASRTYVQDFSGNVLLLCKVKPENVIAVPKYDVTKMRCSAYEILCEIPQNLAQEVYSSKGIQSAEMLEIIRKGICNEYPPATKSTHINGSKAYGSNVIYSDLKAYPVTTTVSVSAPADVAVTVEVKGAQLETSEALQEVRKQKEVSAAPKLTPSQVKSPEKATKMTISEEAQKLWEAFLAAKKAGVRADIKDAAKELQFFKTSKKKGWISLGLDGKTGDKIKPWLE